MSYQRRASPLHACRAGVAAAWSLAVVVAGVLYDHPLVLAALLLVVVAGAAGARVGGRVVAMARYALPFAAVIAVVNALVVRDGLTVIWRFGEVPPFGEVDVTLEALAYGGLLGLRAIVLLLAGALFTATVDPDGLLRLMRRVSFRSALTAALAIRLVPVLQRDGRRLAEAGRCRVDRPGRVAVLRAVTSGALDRAADVAATLELRGYRSPPGARAAAGVREPWSRHDVAFAASAVALLAVAAAGRLAGLAEVEPYPAMQTAWGTSELVLAGALAAVGLLPFADRRGIER